MPAILLKNVPAATPNAVNGLQFEDIPAGGALVTIYASTPTAGGTIDYKVGTEDFLVLAQVNIEAAADVIDNDRDRILFREPVPSGKQFLAVNTQICNVHIVIENAA